MYKLKILLVFALTGTTNILLAQNLAKIDTINIEEYNYSTKIVFNKEMLFDFHGKLDESVECYIDAKKFLLFLDNGARNVYSRKVFTEQEIENHLKKLKQYINNKLEKSNTIIIDRPNYNVTSKMRNILKDENFGIFFLLRWKYFEKQLDAGQVQFYYKKEKFFTEKVVKKIYHEKGRQKTHYYLNVDNRKIYGRSKPLKA